MNKIDYIQRANIKHNNKFIYDLIPDYFKSNEKINIICPEHGEFIQNASSHLNGNGCPACSNLKKLDYYSFIERSNRIHGNKYDYSNVKIINTRTKVIITCPIHGNFEQTPKNHLKGQGCPKCGKKYAQEYHKNHFQQFVNESKNRFGDIYEFPDIEKLYENSHSKILIKCKNCDSVFKKIACDHLTSPNGGCLYCFTNKSTGEEEIIEYLKQKLGNDKIIVRNRSILNNKELDIVIPDYNLAIEYNGIYWHNELYKSKNYHLEKLEECLNKGYNLIQIFEDEYINNKEIVLSKILHIIGKCDNLNKIYGRKCKIKEIDYLTSKEFLNKNHIQGSTSSSIYLGAFYNNELISVMTFKKEKNNNWDLNRFATDISKICIGIGGKLFKYFIKHYNPNEIKSFADRRWTINENNFYTKIGFKKEKYILPDYHYQISSYGCKRIHKFNFRKTKILKKYGEKYNLNKTMTEKEMCKIIGANRIYDCGLIKYIWKKEK